MSETDFNPANRKPHKWERMGKRKTPVSVIISLIVALVYFFVKLPPSTITH